MTAFALEYRLRHLVLVLILALGFFAPWERYTTLSLGSSTWWLFLAALPARAHWLTFTASSQVFLVLGCLAATFGAALRLWGASFLGASVVHAGGLHARQIVAAGPFRYVRNPVYLGTFFSTLALSLTMPPTGAIVAVLLTSVFLLRLISAEEAFILNNLGEPYRQYLGVVPRLVPSRRHALNFTGTSPSYRSGLLSEVFALGVAISFITLGWNFNSTILLKGILVSFGLSLIARAFIPKVADHTDEASGGQVSL